MARYSYRGDALARPDIFQVVVNAVIPGARYGLKCWNKVLASVIGSGDEEIEDLVTRFQTAVTNVGIETQPGTVPNSFQFVGTPGEAMGPASDSSPGCYVRLVRAGVAATAQVFRIVIPVGASGGTYKLTMGYLTLTYDTINLAYNLGDTSLASEIQAAANEAGGISATGVRVALINPGSATESRIYEVTMGGGFTGKNFSVDPDGSLLTGTATVTCRNVQVAAGEATAIQAITIPFLPTPTNGRQQFIKISRDGVTAAEISCEGFTPSGFKTAVDAALATVLGANKAVATVTGYTATVPNFDGEIVVVVRWLALGTQAPLTCVTYTKQPNATPSVSSPMACPTKEIRASGANQNEYLLATVGQGTQYGGVQPADYEVTQGATTWTINHSYTSSQANLVSQWEEGVGSGNAEIHTVSSKFNNIYIMQFKGAKAAIDQLPVTFTTANGRSFQVIANGTPYLNQIDEVIITASGGTFTASSDWTNYTSGLAWNLSSTTFQTALRGLSAIGSGNCNVTGSGTPSDPFRVEYVGDKAITAMPQLKFNTASLQGGIDPTIIVITGGDPGVKQQDQIYIDPNAISGTILPKVNGSPGSAVIWNATATNWTTGIEATGYGVTVTGSVGGPFLVEYDLSGNFAMSLDQSLLVVSESTLFTITQIQESTGPLNYNEPLNWSPPVVPGSEDIAAWMDSPAACQEGLRHECVFTADVATGDFRLGTNVNDCGDFVVGQKVRIATTGTFPTATISGSAHTLSAGTAYYVVSIDRFRRRMQLATSRSGVGIELTGAGTGVHTVFVRLEKLEQRRSHTGPIGRSRRLNNTWEERPRYLKLQASQVDIGAGESGSGTSLCFLDLGSFAFEADVWYTGNASSGEQALQIRLSNGSSNIHTRGGQIGIGTDDQPCVMGNLIAQSTDVTLGLVTLASIDMTGCFHAFPMGITVSGTTRISP